LLKSLYTVNLVFLNFNCIEDTNYRKETIMQAVVSGKIQFSGGNAVRIEPRGTDQQREKYQQHIKISRERDRASRERLLPAEVLQRERSSRERERSPRDRLLPPDPHARERYSRERSPREKYGQPNRFIREHERSSGGGGSIPMSRDRGDRDYPDRASPFERLGHHPISHKQRWETEDRDYG
jgi:hypothetical protein